LLAWRERLAERASVRQCAGSKTLLERRTAVEWRSAPGHGSSLSALLEGKINQEQCEDEADILQLPVAKARGTSGSTAVGSSMIVLDGVGDITTALSIARITFAAIIAHMTSIPTAPPRITNRIQSFIDPPYGALCWRLRPLVRAPYPPFCACGSAQTVS